MEVVEAVRAAVPESDATSYQAAAGQTVLVVRPEALTRVLAFLRDDPAQDYNMLVDITAVDFTPRDGTFHVVYQLLSLRRNARLTVKVKVPGEDPVVPSATGLWKAANWAEREVWDMFGIRFDGHPDLRRILMYPEFVGHPLRKSYPVDKRQPLVPERDPINDPWPSKDGL
ncbi:MAG: NADH-quinone oxidoreductase subunit C [Candidatus Dadabacteria bacterium]|nr:MAG: NADH-quinone oxidoreductase subunit C [Candidatus Dadabacteria bacterium]